MGLLLIITSDRDPNGIREHPSDEGDEAHDDSHHREGLAPSSLLLCRKVAGVGEPQRRARVLNERPRPRVLLVQDDALITSALAERLSEVAPTVQITQYPSNFNLREWDVVVASGPTAYVQQKSRQDGWGNGDKLWEWGYHYPSGVAVLAVVPTQEHGSTHDMILLGVSPSEGTEETPPGTVVVAQSGSVGSHLSMPDGLDPALERLVQRELVPAMRRRKFHRTFHRGGEFSSLSEALPVRPFLLGPDDKMLVGSFDRDERTPIWFLPSDVPDLFPWVVAALKEWHGRFPDRFPAVPDWAAAVEWMTNTERTLLARREDNESWIRERIAEYKEREASIAADLDVTRQRANQYERALLTADGDDLVDAVGCALAELGFHVVDMDQYWPDGQRKEDLRLLDGDAPGWVGLAEVKGFTSGIKEIGFTALVRWGQFYVQETGQLPSASWYVANGFRRDDPSTRPEPYVGRDDALDVVEEASGLVLDTRAIFDLLRITREDPSQRAAARRMLRDGRRRVTRVAAADISDAHD